MQTIVMPKNPRTYDYFVGSLSYIAGCTRYGKNLDVDEVIKFETDDLPCNTASEEVKDYLKDAFSSKAKEITFMVYDHNICDPVICSNKPAKQKIKEIACCLMMYILPDSVLQIS